MHIQYMARWQFPFIFSLQLETCVDYKIINLFCLWCSSFRKFCLTILLEICYHYRKLNQRLKVVDGVLSLLLMMLNTLGEGSLCIE